MYPPYIDQFFVQIKSVLDWYLLVAAFGELHDLGNKVTRVRCKRWKNFSYQGGQGIYAAVC